MATKKELEQKIADLEAAAAAAAAEIEGLRALAPRRQRSRKERIENDGREGLLGLLDSTDGWESGLMGSLGYSLAPLTDSQGRDLADSRVVVDCDDNAILNLGHLRGSASKPKWASAVVRHDYTLVHVDSLLTVRPDLGEYKGSLVKFNRAGELAFFDSGIAAHLTYDGKHSLELQRWAIVDGAPVTGKPVTVGVHKQGIFEALKSFDFSEVPVPSPRYPRRHIEEYIVRGAPYREGEILSLTERLSARLFTLISPQCSSFSKYCLGWTPSYRKGQSRQMVAD